MTNYVKYGVPMGGSGTGQGATGGGDQAEGLVDALVQAAFVTMAVLTRVAAAHDLSLTQLRVLAILRDRQVRMTALADHLGLEKSTMSGLVDRAEARGLLQRVRGTGDGRAIDVVITGAGQELAGRVRADVGGALSPLVESLGGAERDRLQELLEDVLAPNRHR